MSTGLTHEPNRIFITVIGFLVTFAWLLVPELKASPAVLWPSVLAVGVAFVTRDIYLSLFLGAFSGVLLLHGGNPWTAFHDLLIGRMIPSLMDRWNISVLIFTLMMGGFAEVLTRNGGMTALSQRVMGQSRSPRRAGLGAYLMGWLVFFDGLASSVLVGKSMRPIADRAASLARNSPSSSIPRRHPSRDFPCSPPGWPTKCPSSARASRIQATRCWRMPSLLSPGSS